MIVIGFGSWSQDALRRANCRILAGGRNMQPDRFTIKAAEAIQAAQQRAQSLGNPEVTPLHLLAALVSEGGAGAGGESGGIIVPLLEKAGAHVGRIREIVESELKRLPKVSGGSLTAHRRFGDVLEAADKLAQQMKDQYVSTEHLLLALA